MSNISIFNDLLEIYNILDGVDNLDSKLSTIKFWLKTLPGISQAEIFHFAGTIDQEEDNFSMDQELDNFNNKSNASYLKDLLPAVPGIIYCENDAFNAFTNSTGWTGEFLGYPIHYKNGVVAGAILLKGENEEQLHSDYDMALKFLVSKIKEALENNILKDKLEKENDFLNLFISQNTSGLDKIISSKNSTLINWINLPLYIADINGKILYANNLMLHLLKIKDLKELNDGFTLYPHPEQRQNELNQLLIEGRVDNHELFVMRKDGKILEVRDSAILMGAYIFGFFFDVTELVKLNREITEALGMQEFLNDKLISSSLLLQRTQATTIRSLARLAEYRDGETGEHLDRICEYSAVITDEVFKKQPYNWHISQKYISDLIVSSMLHDIGKVGVSDTILLKPGKLNKQEFERIKFHTIWGWEILNKADKELGEQSYLTIAAAIALHHHEHYDGNGYPHQLEKENIPLSARIEAVADVYDALTSNRPYKVAWSHDQAVEEIKAQKGKQFDPVLVDIFLSIEDKIFTIRNKLAK